MGDIPSLVRLQVQPIRDMSDDKASNNIPVYRDRIYDIPITRWRNAIRGSGVSSLASKGSLHERYRNSAVR
jgi:hypothetical protein